MRVTRRRFSFIPRSAIPIWRATKLESGTVANFSTLSEEADLASDLETGRKGSMYHGQSNPIHGGEGWRWLPLIHRTVQRERKRERETIN